MPVQGYTQADLARLRSIHTRPQGWTNATRDLVREYRDAKRRPVKVITDQLGNKVRLRWTGQDARIYLPCLRVRGRAEEVR